MSERAANAKATGDRWVIEILNAAAFLIADEGQWVQGHWAVRGDGSPCMSGDRDAARFSVFAAVEVASEMVARNAGVFHPEKVKRKQGEVNLALKAALDPRWGGVPHFNDSSHTTHADVLALFARAIELERGGANALPEIKSEERLDAHV